MEIVTKKKMYLKKTQLVIVKKKITKSRNLKYPTNLNQKYTEIWEVDLAEEEELQSLMMKMILWLKIPRNLQHKELKSWIKCMMETKKRKIFEELDSTNKILMRIFISITEVEISIISQITTIRKFSIINYVQDALLPYRTKSKYVQLVIQCIVKIVRVWEALTKAMDTLVSTVYS